MKHHDTIPFTFKTRDELLLRLEGMRTMVAKLDAQAKKQHTKDEQAWAKRAKAAAREFAAKLSKMSYEQMKNERHGWRSGFAFDVTDENGNELTMPRCPDELLTRLERAIEVVARIPPETTRIRVAANGQYDYIHSILMLGVRSAHKQVC